MAKCPDCGKSVRGFLPKYCDECFARQEAELLAEMTAEKIASNAMTLIPCRACGNAISRDAPRCPRCGAQPAQAAARSSRLIGAVILGLLVTGGYALYYNSDAARGDREAHAALEAWEKTDAAVIARDEARDATDQEIAADVRVIDSATVRRCHHLGHVETAGEPTDGTPGLREMRLESLGRQHFPDKGNAILITTPPEWARRVSGEMYHCPE